MERRCLRHGYRPPACVPDISAACRVRQAAPLSSSYSNKKFFASFFQERRLFFSEEKKQKTFSS
jgi:hypothetical protein